MSIEKVRAFFAARGREGDIREFSVSSATVELAAVAAGCEAARIAKTLSFAVGDGCVLVVCAGDTRIDNAKFKAPKQRCSPPKRWWRSPATPLEAFVPLPSKIRR